MSSCTQCRQPIAPGTRVCPGCYALQPVVSDSSAFAKGTVIDRGHGRFVLDAPIGEGGMGTVLRAWLFHAPDGPRRGEPPELVALKMLRVRAAIQDEQRARFSNEADTLRRLRHPNIVRFYDLFEWRSMQVLAMEYVDGETLATLIERHVARARQAPGSLPGLPFRRAWYYFEQLLGALAAIHTLGIVHRDIKPSNVLLRRDGIVKLADFGIARLVSGGTPGVRTGLIAPGTSAYMSPEQVLSLSVDARSDLYSAALVLYEMLAGSSPFPIEEKMEFAIRQDQVQTPPTPLRTHVPQAPQVIDQLFASALAKAPGQRFPDAIGMGNAFRTALGLPDWGGWAALCEIARDAPLATEPDAPPGTLRFVQQNDVRDQVVDRYRTVLLPTA